MRAASDVRGEAGRRRWLIAAVVLSVIGAVAVPTAGAQNEVPEGAGDYGGGTIAKLGKGPYSAGNMVISLQPASGRVLIEAWLGERCHLLQVTENAQLKPDGSFSVDGAVRERQSGYRLRSTYEITGVFGAAGTATGTASAKTRVTKPKHRTRRCKTGTVRWEARRRSMGVIGTPAATPPGARLYGNTSQDIFDMPTAITLRVSGDGTRLTRAIYSQFLDCGGHYYHAGLDSPATSLPIAADGTVSDVERATYRVDHRTRATSVGRFKGTLGSTGARGTLSLRVREVDIPTGRVRRCHTGAVKWAASL